MKLAELQATIESLEVQKPQKLFMCKKLFREFVDQAVFSADSSIAKQPQPNASTPLPHNCVARLSGIEVYTSEFLPYGMVFDQDMKRIA